MSYATQADLENILPVQQLLALTDDDNTGIVNTAIVDNALETASITIDSYLADKLPFATVPPILQILCAQVAGYLLYVRRGDVPEIWSNQHAAVLKYLTNVGAGKLSLGVGDPAGTGVIDTLQISAAPAIFSREEMDKY